MATGRIGTTPVLQVRWSKAPSAGTTSLSGLDDNSVSLVYSVGYEAVYRNGVLLSRTNDYTATNGTTITLIDATITGDIIEVFANQTIPLSDTYSQTVANGKFINNTLTTTTGDIIYASAANTPARLGIGSTDQVLKVSGGIPVWATPASGGMTVIASGTLSGAETSLTSIPSTYVNLFLVINNPYLSSGSGLLQLRVNSITSSIYGRWFFQTNGSNGGDGSSVPRWNLNDSNISNLTTSQTYVSASVWLWNYANTTSQKSMSYQVQDRTNTFNSLAGTGGMAGADTSAISSVQIITNSSTFAGGTYTLYGVK